MILYCSRTGTAKNLTSIRARGWRLLVSATGVWRAEGLPYALDNGAFSYWQQKLPFDEVQFGKLLDAMGADADWVIAPDIVGGGLESLGYSLSWLDRCLAKCHRVLIAVQEGMTAADIDPLVGGRVGIFIGGAEDSWKESTASTWGAVARRKGAYLHMGRVNTARRILIAQNAGCHSVDGTSASKFLQSHPLLDRSLRQGALLLNEDPCP